MLTSTLALFSFVTAQRSLIFFSLVWAPYVASNPSSLLLLDEFNSHIQPVFGRQLSDLGTDLNIIPGGYTSVLQPCDVGVDKPIKEAVRAQYDDWAAEKMATIHPDANVLVPKREDIVPWIVRAWDGITEQSIRNTFASIGFGVERIDTEPVDESDREDEIEEVKIALGSKLFLNFT
ncbi:unnamed protein product [Phytophthora lilii]|uniref:Unnamed protein product n=1 Tax=Phytophthora lilii TaxID=2077276 RepID=A0A9W6X5U0_9STRA|nr:unnamed protein product [Phytophthora lilii]